MLCFYCHEDLLSLRILTIYKNNIIICCAALLAGCQGPFGLGCWSAGPPKHQPAPLTFPTPCPTHLPHPLPRLPPHL